MIPPAASHPSTFVHTRQRSRGAGGRVRGRRRAWYPCRVPPDAARVVRDVLAEFTQPVRDPVWQNIKLSPGMSRLALTAPFQRLRDIRQLGPVYLVYPGATHTRLNHSLGVMHLAGRMVAAIAERSPQWRIEAEEVRAFLAATLLHDLGHYPNAHSLKDLPVARHEALTAEAVQEGEVAQALRDHVRAPPALVAAIIDAGRAHPAPSLPFLRALLAGVLDPDRLDYLSRDAFFCGVPYGIQDVDFVIGEMRRSACGRVAITEKGTLAVESLLFARYLMYRAVYWHRTVRIATAMIKRAVLLGIRDGQVRPPDLYGLTDAGFLRLLDAGRHPAFGLIDAVRAGRLYRQALRIRFDRRRADHRGVERPHDRLPVERRLRDAVAAELGRTVAEHEVLIDVPERNSFATDLLVQPEDGTEPVPFAQAHTVFGPEVVARFGETLRSIAVIGSRRPGLDAALRRVAPAVIGAGVSAVDVTGA